MLKIEDIKISKELIEAVMGTKFEKNTSDNDILIIDVTSKETILSYPRDCDCCRESINLYQFADKCKKWAVASEFGIMTSENKEGLSIKLFIGGLVTKEFPPTIPEQAIINYCEWILNYKKEGMLLSEFKKNIF